MIWFEWKESGMTVRELTSDEYDDVVRDNRFVVVKYWAAWCPPCRAFTPIFEKVSAERPDIVFASVDVDRETIVSARNNVASIPTVIMYRDGEQVNRLTGAVSQKDFTSILNDTFGVRTA